MVWECVGLCSAGASLKTTERYCLPVMEAKILAAGCQEGHTPSKTCRAEAFLAFSGNCLVIGVLQLHSSGLPSAWASLLSFTMDVL